MTYEKYAEHIHELIKVDTKNEQSTISACFKTFLKFLVDKLENKYKNKICSKGLKEQIRYEFLNECKLYFNGNLPFDENLVFINSDKGNLQINICENPLEMHYFYEK